MNRPARLGVWLDSYRRDLKSGLHAAADDKFRIIQVDGTRAELSPRTFGTTARRHLARYIEQLGLRLDALGALFPGRGLADPARADERFAALQDVLRLCADLRVPNAIVTLGAPTHQRDTELAQQILESTADLADRYGVRVSVYGGPQSGQVTEQIERLGCPSLALALDTADAVEQSPIVTAAVPIGAVHLRDVRRRGRQVEEVPLGQGEVDWPTLMGALVERGYDGVLTIRSDRADASVDALRHGRDYVLSRFPAVCEP